MGSLFLSQGREGVLCIHGCLPTRATRYPKHISAWPTLGFPRLCRILFIFVSLPHLLQCFLAHSNQSNRGLPYRLSQHSHPSLGLRFLRPHPSSPPHLETPPLLAPPTRLLPQSRPSLSGLFQPSPSIQTPSTSSAPSPQLSPPPPQPLALPSPLHG